MSQFKTTAQYYADKAHLRETILNRARSYAAWTLPYLVPEVGIQETTELQNDVQSLGAQAVNHLANQLYVTLFGQSRPFYRLEVNPKIKGELNEAGIKDAFIDEAISNAERQGMRELVRLGAADPLIMLLQYLVVTGNALLYFPEKKGEAMQVYSMQDYVIERDLGGKVIRIVTKDKKQFNTLPQDVQDKRAAMRSSTHTIPKPEDDVSLYTDIKWNGKKYIITQSIDDTLITEAGKEGKYTADTLEWIPLAWKMVRGESWGRGHVEDYAGDFHTLSQLERYQLEFTAISSQIKGLVDPAGHVDIDELNAAPNGGYVSGKEGDVSLLQVQNIASMELAQVQIDKKEARLKQAFLLHVDAIRDAERVTAEEVRFVANQLEVSLGGVFTRLSQSLQLPMVKRILPRIDFQLDEKIVEPLIITGIEALSRSSELDSFRLFMQDLTMLDAVPEEFRQEFDLSALMALLGSSHGVDYQGITKSAEQKQVDAEQQRAAEEQAMDDQVYVDTAPGAIQAEQANNLE